MQEIPTKVDGVDTLPAAEFNQIPDEIEAAIQSANLTLSSGDLTQLVKSITTYAAVGEYYTASGTASAYTLATVGARIAPPSYYDGMKVRFIPNLANGTSPTINVAGLGVKDIRQPDGVTAIVANSFTSNDIVTLHFSVADDCFKFFGTVTQFNVPLLAGDRQFSTTLFPTVLSDTQVRVPSGFQALDDTGAVIMTAGSNLDVDITNSGALGLDTGSEAASTVYYLWMSQGASGVTAFISTSSTAPTLPAGYDDFKIRLPYAVTNDASSNLYRQEIISGWPYNPTIYFVGSNVNNIASPAAPLTSLVLVGSSTVVQPSFGTASVAAFVPVTSDISYLHLRSPNSIYVREAGTSNYWGTHAYIGTTPGPDFHQHIPVKVDGSQQFEFTGDSALTKVITLLGYTINNI